MRKKHHDRMQDHGVHTRKQLHTRGFNPSQIRTAVNRGRLRRIRPGWFATPQADLNVVRAVALGGCCGCISALRHHGVWVPETTKLHMRAADHITVKHSSCRPFGANPPVVSAVDDIDTAIRSAARCLNDEQFVVVLDSLLHLKRATEHQLRTWLRQAPLRVQRLVDMTAEAEAGTETMTRLRLRAKGVRARTQVWLAADCRVDLLIGDRLVIECDSERWHGSWEARERDLARDRMLVAKGFLVIRLSYRQIHDQWPLIERDLLQIIRDRRHVWPRQRTEVGLSGAPRG